MKPSDPLSVLFASTHNSVRAPIAAAIARQKLEGRLKAESCGIEPDELSPFAFGVCEEAGFNLVPHHGHRFSDIDISQFDLVIALSAEAVGEARAAILSSRKAIPLEFWPVPEVKPASDGKGPVLMPFRQCRDLLLARIQARFKDIWPQ
ncbi:MAG: low molecular weight phosphatase family protein [Dongiaceae bacterium]